MNAAEKYYMRIEMLIWNTRLKMQRGVEVTGNGVGLLNGQTTKRDSIASLEAVGVGLFTKQRFRIRDHVAKYTWVISWMFLRS
jgi:hypothetical protein